MPVYPIIRILEWVWLFHSANCFLHLTLRFASYCRPPACQFHPQHPFTNIFTICPLDVSKLSGFISKTSNVHRPSDVLIPSAIQVTPRENWPPVFSSMPPAASEPHKLAHAHSRQRFVKLYFHSRRDCYRAVTPVVFPPPAPTCPHTPFHCSGMLTLSASNPPRCFICAPCYRISPRECELNQKLWN